MIRSGRSGYTKPYEVNGNEKVSRGYNRIRKVVIDLKEENISS